MAVFSGRLLLRRRGRGLVSFEKTFDLFLFIHLRGTDRVQRLHLFELFLREPWKVADERDEMPRRAVVFWSVLPPGRHPGHPDPVLDDEKDLPVRKRLRLLPPHVGGLRIEVLADLGLS